MALTINIQNYNEEVVESTGVSGTTTIDVSQSNSVSHVISGDVTYEFSNVSTDPQGNSVSLLIEDGGGGYLVSWPSSVEWTYGETPTWEDGEKKVISLVTFDGGTTWVGAVSAERLE